VAPWPLPTHLLVAPMHGVLYYLHSNEVDLTRYENIYSEVTGYPVPGYPVEGGPPLLDVRKVEVLWSPYHGSDSDGDGIPGSWEIANSLDPYHNDANSDTDSDGVTAIREFAWGTDPNSSWSHMKRIEIKPDPLTRGISLSWNCAPGKIYQVYYTDGPPAPGADWKPLGDPLVFEECAELTIIDEEATTGSCKTRFYRIGVTE